MTSLRRTAAALTFAGLLVLTAADGLGQPPDQKDFFQKKGFGPFGGGERKILKDHDKDGDGRLNTDERAAAREALKKQGGGKGGFGPKMGFGKGGEPGRPGPDVAPSEVKNYPNAALYETNVLRTLFLEFENKDWETELQDFHGTDVEVPCTMTVDGKKYPNVGVHFRGMSSYGGVPAGSKRSMNLSLDLADKKQRLYGAKTLNLLNAHEDASFMSTVLYSHVARQYIPAPKANFVKVVINGESWGLYVNVQQFDKEFLEENFKTDKGARWKVSGSPGGGGGLEYLGDNIADYKRRYEIKSKDDDKSWTALINLCKVLNQTPPDKLEEALRPIADVDGLLWFLALDIALINNDGYWIRASDYSLYLDAKGKFHCIPHDMNESFRPGGGPGFGGDRIRVLGRPGEVLPLPLQDMLGLTAEQKKKLADLQKETDDKLGKIFTEDQNKQWKQIREGGPGGFGPPGFGPPGGPGGFGPPPGGPGFGPPPGGPGGPPPMGKGGPGSGPGGGGVEIDPLFGLTDARKPLRSKVLASPTLRAKYLANVKTIAEDALDWKRLGPVVAMYRSVIEKDVQADTRKLESFEAFQRMTADVADPNARGRGIPLRAFADQRRKYLLAYQEPAKGK